MSRMGETIQAIEELYEAGLSVKEICKRLDTSQDFVKTVIQQLQAA